ncbi:MAG: hypothetical protein KatS3mg110_0512 [Pirellulaceae bacterium]|nr:MAG: hypothetical protein KatS3mg110_0512 [Pirellulaceae bacterium]
MKKWIEQATKNYLRTQCRKKGTTAIPLSALANEAGDGDGGNFEIADKKLPPDKETIDRLQRCVDAFENIHQLIEQGLEVLVKAVDFRAVYLWLFRTELYRVARCEYGSSPDWYSCLTLVEDCCSWAGNRGGLKFRQGWPPIGKLWELLRAHRERAENLDVSLVVVVAKKTHPDLNAKPCQLYQWFRRLRNHIMAEFTEDKLLAAAGSREHLQAWQNIIMCSEDR